MIPARFRPMRESGKQARKRKEKRDVTDRALRYRAQANAPPGPRVCALCGSTRNIDIGHINGHEEDNSAANKLYMCRSCNVRCGNTLRRAGSADSPSSTIPRLRARRTWAHGSMRS